MTATTLTTANPSTTTAPRRLWTTGVLAGLAAAAATSVTAALVHAAGVPLELDGEPVPVTGFAVMTLAAVLVGTLLAAAVRRYAVRPRRTFVAITTALTVLSFVPDLLVAASASTTVSLMATHVIAAAIVVPALAARLDRR